jgi:DNA-binding TFAR19-related protein (PDSD5 family)
MQAELTAEISRLEAQIENVEEQIEEAVSKAETATRRLIAGHRDELDIAATARGRVETLRIVRSNLSEKLESVKTELAEVERVDQIEAAKAAAAVEANEANSIWAALLEERCKLGLAIERSFKRTQHLQSELTERRAGFRQHLDVLMPGLPERRIYTAPKNPAQMRGYLEDIKCQNDNISLDVALSSDGRRELWIETFIENPARLNPEMAQWEEQAAWLLETLRDKATKDWATAEAQREKRPTSSGEPDPMRHYTPPEPAQKVSVFPSGQITG